MSIDYRAVLVIGLPRDELREWEDRIEEEDEEWDSYLDGFSPYYDSGSLLLGIDVATTYDYSIKELDEELLTVGILAAKREFEEITGLEGKLFLTTHGH